MTKRSKTPKDDDRQTPTIYSERIQQELDSESPEAKAERHRRVEEREKRDEEFAQEMRVRDAEQRQDAPKRRRRGGSHVRLYENELDALTPLPPLASKVYQRLKFRRNSRTGVAFMSGETLTGEVDRGLSQVKEAVKALRVAGLIETEQTRRKRGFLGANEYRFPLHDSGDYGSRKTGSRSNPSAAGKPAATTVEPEDFFNQTGACAHKENAIQSPQEPLP